MSKVLNKILYVEDDINIQAISQVALTTIGNFEICCCYSGKEALEKIDEFDPDLVLSDVMMPEVDGPTMLKTLRNDPKYDKVPVVFISARAQKHEIDEYKRIGAAEVISKPFDPLSLPEELKAIWANLQSE
jgi:CheY-like chemotaxis protein